MFYAVNSKGNQFHKIYNQNLLVVCNNTIITKKTFVYKASLFIN